MNFQNQFYIVRHGESENNVLGIESVRLETQTKYGLTENGRLMAAKAAKEHTDFDIIYASPFRRTQETAEFFAQTSNCEIILDERLCESCCGDYDEAPYDKTREFEKNHDLLTIPYPGGESLRDLEVRITSFFQEIDSICTNQKILVVTHGSSIEMVFFWLQNKTPKTWQDSVEKAKVYSLSTFKKRT